MSLAGSNKQEHIEEFLRKSLLGEELINTQFHLFSTKSVPSKRVTNPRVLCANNVLLAKCSKYFVDLLSSDINPSDDSSLSDLTDVNDIPREVQIDDYGYGSDSDLDDDGGETLIPIKNPNAPLDESVVASTPSPRIGHTDQLKNNDEFSENDSESDSSEMFVMSPEHPRTDIPFSVDTQGTGSVASTKTAFQDAQNRATVMSHDAVRLQSLGSRHVLVKDTAFQTWYTLLNYLYTGKSSFLPLTSTAPEVPRPLIGVLDEPSCSAKSMYRLASKVGLDELREKALSHIQSNLTEKNILQELSCSLASKHPELLEMELDVLYTHIASPPVAMGFPALARRIADKELLHGVHIVVGIYERLLRERQSLPSTPTYPLPPPPPSLPSPSLSPSSYPLPPPGVFETLSTATLDLTDTTENGIGPVPVDKAQNEGFVPQLASPKSLENSKFDEKLLDKPRSESWGLAPKSPKNSNFVGKLWDEPGSQSWGSWGSAPQSMVGSIFDKALAGEPSSPKFRSETRTPQPPKSSNLDARPSECEDDITPRKKNGPTRKSGSVLKGKKCRVRDSHESQPQLATGSLEGDVIVTPTVECTR